MHKLTFAQMRQSVPRLLAAGIAIAIGVGFVAATLVGTQVYTRSTLNTLAAEYGQADLILNVHALGDEDVASYTAGVLDGVDSVAAFYPREVASGQIAGTSGEIKNIVLRPTPSRSEFFDGQIIHGTLTSNPDHVMLPEQSAQSLGVGVGDQVTVSSEVFDPTFDDSQTGSPWITTSWTVEVGAIYEPGSEMFSATGAAVFIDPERFAEVSYDSLADFLILTQDGYSVSEARSEIAAYFPGYQAVQTPQERAAYDLDATSNSTDLLLITVLIFAAVALVVAAMVIANTFQVLIAQRAQTLAMLRCTGASAAQLRVMVRIEALTLGLISACIGVAGVFGIGQILLSIFASAKPHLLLPTVLPLSPMSVLIPVLAGVAVTLLAAQGATHAVTGISPLAALRPHELAGNNRGTVILRGILALILTGLGGAIGLHAWSSKGSLDESLPLLLGVVAVALIFTGLLVIARWWLPWIVNGIGSLVQRLPFGVSGSLARANARRNPQRTAATASALLIGVTLVTAMSAGAASTKATLTHQLDVKYSYDAIVDLWDPELADSAEGVLRAHPNVAALTASGEYPLAFTYGPAAAGYSDPQDLQMRNAYGADHEELSAVLRNPDAITGFQPGVLFVNPYEDAGDPTPRSVAKDGDVWFGYRAGDKITVTSVSYERDGEYLDEPVEVGQPLALTVQFSNIEGITLVNRDEAGAAGWEAIATHRWVRLANLADAVTTIDQLREELLDLDAVVIAPAAERALYEQIISVLLTIVIALLAVAVIIAVIGVTNTLSLSVLERRRESATLRSVGLSARQLRLSLGLEGIVTALAGTVAGIGIGLVAGWYGSQIMLQEIGQVVFVIPWPILGVTLVIAALAGWIASWVPARMASREQPIAALAAV